MLKNGAERERKGGGGDKQTNIGNERVIETKTERDRDGYRNRDREYERGGGDRVNKPT